MHKSRERVLERLFGTFSRLCRHSRDFFRLSGPGPEVMGLISDFFWGFGPKGPRDSCFSADGCPMLRVDLHGQSLPDPGFSD